MNKKKTFLQIAGFSLLLVLILIASSCTPKAPTKRDVVGDFISGINNQNLSAVKNTLDSSANDYNTADMSFWNTYFGSRPYSISSFNTSNTTAQVHFTASGSGSDIDMHFEFNEEAGSLFEEGSCKIRRIRMPSGTSPVIFE